MSSKSESESENESRILVDVMGYAKDFKPFCGNEAEKSYCLTSKDWKRTV